MSEMTVRHLDMLVTSFIINYHSLAMHSLVFTFLSSSILFMLLLWASTGKAQMGSLPKGAFLGFRLSGNHSKVVEIGHLPTQGQED